jgi:hypothetical protein
MATMLREMALGALVRASAQTSGTSTGDGLPAAI